MKYVLNKYKTKLYEFLDLTTSEPEVREAINDKFIDIVFYKDPKNILSGVFVNVALYVTLMFFDFNWYLHAWIIFLCSYYFVRYALLQFSKNGQFLGIKHEFKRHSDMQVVLHGVILGGSVSILYLIVAFPPYPEISELLVVIAALIFLNGALSLNSNLPLWCLALTTSMIVPMALIMVSKGGVHVMTGIIIGFYGFFIFYINLRFYKLYFDSYLNQYQNKIYIDQLNDAKEKKLKEFVVVLQKKNEELTNENRLRKNAEKRVQQIAYMDVLTGLTNRVSLDKKMNMAIRQAKRTETYLGVFFIDLDRFKFINDTFGHDTGDELLKSVAQRLQSCLRSTDLVFRIGGDEFIMVLTNVKRPEVILSISENIRTILGQPHNLFGKLVTSTASMGISIYPQNGTTPEDLMKNADIAMYKAKKSGGNSFFFYTEEINKLMLRRLQVERLLQNALAEEGFNFLYQPIVCLKTGNIIAAEALIRFSESHMEEENIEPNEFIPIAEAIGLVGKVGQWVIEEACKTLKKWEAIPRSSLKITINISVKHLVDNNFLSQLKFIINTYQIDPSLLEIEITESQAVENMEFVNSVLEKIVSMGIRLSIDNFGTSHSNFSYLKDIPISKIKIDRSFLSERDLNIKSRSIIRAIISVGKALDLNVVAVGIESADQLKFLRKTGCDYGQGYLFSQPVSEEEFIKLVEKGGFDLEKMGESPDLGRVIMDRVPIIKNREA